MMLFALLAGTLTLGSPAPALALKTWVKGAPVREFPRKGLVVVEFWATWCVPCRDSIPHLTELAKRNRDVTFVGVSVLENNADRRVQRFVQAMGSKMDYRIGYGGDRDGMARTWLTAAGQDAIPTAFIVKDRRIAWIGHPMEMAAPLAQIRAGRFDTQAYLAKTVRDRVERARQEAATTALDDAEMKFHTGQRSEAEATLTAAVARDPRFAPQAAAVRFAWLAKDDPAAWETQASAMANERPGLERLLDFAKSQAAESPKQARQALNLVVQASDLKDFDMNRASEDDFNLVVRVPPLYATLGEYGKALDATNALLARLDAKHRPEYGAPLAAWKRNYEAKLKKAG